MKYIYLLAVLLLLASCTLTPEQLQAIGESVRLNLEASGKFTEEQSAIIGGAVAEAVGQFGDQGSGWRGVLATVGDAALGLILGYFGISRGARAVKAVKAAKASSQS